MAHRANDLVLVYLSPIHRRHSSPVRIHHISISQSPTNPPHQPLRMPQTIPRPRNHRHYNLHLQHHRIPNLLRPHGNALVPRPPQNPRMLHETTRMLFLRELVPHQCDHDSQHATLRRPSHGSVARGRCTRAVLDICRDIVLDNESAYCVVIAGDAVQDGGISAADVYFGFERDVDGNGGGGD